MSGCHTHTSGCPLRVAAAGGGAPLGRRRHHIRLFSDIRVRCQACRARCVAVLNGDIDGEILAADLWTAALVIGSTRSLENASAGVREQLHNSGTYLTLPPTVGGSCCGWRGPSKRLRRLQQWRHMLRAARRPETPSPTAKLGPSQATAES